MKDLHVLRRYTSLAVLMDMLHRRAISFMNPNSWDDRNDAFSLERFRQVEGCGSVTALCLTGADETYHHWKIFAPGMEGACIWFDREALIERFEDDADILQGEVIYHTIAELKQITPTAHQMPFLKRLQFADEREYRIIAVDDDAHIDRCEFEIDLGMIRRITLSPWMPPTVADSVKATLKAIPGHEIKVYRSTLVENRDWKAVFRGMG